MKTIHSFYVEGMTCGNCALTISKLLERKGTSGISTNAATGEVHFATAAGQDVTPILDAIDGLGYRVVRGDDPAAGAAAAHDDHGSDRWLWLCVLLTVPLLLHMFVDWPWIHDPWFQLVLSTPVFIIGWRAFGGSALRSLRHRLPNMNVLILLGASAAYGYSLIGLLGYTAHAHQYLFFETTASIITLVMTGNWLEHKTVRSTTASIDALARLQPATARLLMTDSLGKETVMEVESRYIRSGDLVLVNEGDAIPVDGEVEAGEGLADEHMISGESMPVAKKPGDAVVGGTLLAQGPLRVRATTVGNASILSGIVRLVREAQAIKPPLQKLADRISAVFVPLVLGIALLTFIVNYFFVVHSFPEAMMRSIAVMVIACPCAMGLATPAAVAVGLGRAARNGILVKGGDTLERMKTLRQIVFDKTGTLTTGELSIHDFVTAGMSDAAFKSVVAALEMGSSHPIARSVQQQWGTGERTELSSLREIKGKGMEGTDTAGVRYRLGAAAWLWQPGMPEDYDLYLLRDGVFAGALRLVDALRPDAAETVRVLKERGYKTILLSGDKEEKCREIAAALGLDAWYAQQGPEQKNEILDKLMTAAPTAMVGDGINDAPALARASVGISLSNATQIAIQSANVILSNNHLSSLPRAIRLGIYTDQTIRQNLFWALCYNVVAIPVAASGLLTPTWGAGIMALSDVVLVLNSLRLGLRRL